MGKGILVFGVLVSIAILLIVFFALRGVMLWYWRINEIVTKMDHILAELKRLSERT